MSVCARALRITSLQNFSLSIPSGCFTASRPALGNLLRPKRLEDGGFLRAGRAAWALGQPGLLTEPGLPECVLHFPGG